MKVLFLTNIPSPYRVDFFNELGKYCDLTVLYELGYATDRDKNWKSDDARNFKEVFLKGKRIGADSALCFSIIKFLNDNSYDIIVIGGYSTPTGMLAIEYLKLKKKKFILNCDGGIIKEDSKRKLLIKKHFISSASAWLSTGKMTDDYLVHYGANKEKIYRYPLTSIKECNILSQTVSDKEKIFIREKLNIKDKKVILSVGQFIYRKGYDVLIEAMKYLPEDYGVYIVGGEATEEYKELKNRYKLTNLNFVGFKTKGELAEYYKAADLFVLPTREDIWGLVINEAMSYGLPIITTDKCLAGLELINKNGYIVKTNDHEELSMKIIKILEDHILKEKMENLSLNIIGKYTIESMAKEHYKILELFINGRNTYDK